MAEVLAPLVAAATVALITLTLITTATKGRVLDLRRKRVTAPRTTTTVGEDGSGVADPGNKTFPPAKAVSVCLRRLFLIVALHRFHSGVSPALLSSHLPSTALSLTPRPSVATSIIYLLSFCLLTLLTPRRRSSHRHRSDSDYTGSSRSRSRSYSYSEDSRSSRSRSPRNRRSYRSYSSSSGSDYRRSRHRRKRSRRSRLVRKTMKWSLGETDRPTEID